MFPELIDGNGLAFVISNLWRSVENFKTMKVLKEDGGTLMNRQLRLLKDYQTITESGKGKRGHRSLVGNRTNGLLKRDKDSPDDDIFVDANDGLPCMIAQIEYPYVVKVQFE